MMTQEPPFDARCVANLILDFAERDGRCLSNLVLQKLAYFAHGTFLSRTGKPLLNGEFEAWKHGPVHPHIYHAFKDHGAEPIRGRAGIVNPVTRERRTIPEIRDAAVRDIIEDVYRSLRYRSPAALRAVSHAKNAPWWAVVERAKKRESVSLRIPNAVIQERFRFHAISMLSSDTAEEVPNENSPFGEEETDPVSMVRGSK